MNKKNTFINITRTLKRKGSEINGNIFASDEECLERNISVNNLEGTLKKDYEKHFPKQIEDSRYEHAMYSSIRRFCSTLLQYAHYHINTYTLPVWVSPETAQLIIGHGRNIINDPYGRLS